MSNNLKKLFPLFSNQKEPFSYLDNAATTQKPQSVIEALSYYYLHNNANIKRGLYPMGEIATTQYEESRKKVAQFINAESPEEIIFTKGATEGLNLVAQAWALENISDGDEILLSQAEHHANLVPWQHIAKKVGANLRFIPINNKTYMADYDDSMITEKTKLVALCHTSNVLGSIWSNTQDSATALEPIINRAHKVGAKVLFDAAQSMAHEKVDVQKLRADFFIFSSHKMFGPMGVGVLYINKRMWPSIEPYQRGGGMVHAVSFHDDSWAQLPNKLEAGTPAVGGVIGLAAAIDFINDQIDYQELHKHETLLNNKILKAIQDLDDAHIVGNIDGIKKMGHLVNFSVTGIHPHDLASFLGNNGVALRAGHHCAQPLVTMLGFDSLVRASVAAYNTLEDVELFANALTEAVSYFRS